MQLLSITMNVISHEETRDLSDQLGWPRSQGIMEHEDGEAWHPDHVPLSTTAFILVSLTQSILVNKEQI